LKIAKLLKFGKKGVKMTSKTGSKDAKDAGYEWPDGIRIGLYGHSISGKTVFYTVLNEDCRAAGNLQISVTDKSTATELLGNFRKIWGIGGPTAEFGTVVDRREEQSFPDPTQTDRVLQFTAIVDRVQKLPIVAYDYPGDAVSINRPNDYTDKVIDFMTGCDGLLFLFDPKLLGSEVNCQAHVASFVNMLERLAPLNRRLPIPVALVVTKADCLPGFAGENQVRLIEAGKEQVVCEEYDTFLERLLSSPSLTSNSRWAGSVREILVKLKDFIRVVLGRTLDFQIYFTSHTGHEPKKVGEEVGRSIYKPPEKISPVGLREPMHWLVSAVARNRRLSTLCQIKKLVRIACLTWIVLCSAVFGYHLWLQLGRATGTENQVLQGRSPLESTENDRREIMRGYNRYESQWLVRNLFPQFGTKAKDLAQKYGRLHTSSRGERLDSLVNRITKVISNESQWPPVAPGGTEVSLSPAQQEIERGLAAFTSDSASELFPRAALVQTTWISFITCISAPTDSAWKELGSTVEYYEQSSEKHIGIFERNLMGALKTLIASKVEQTESQTEVKEAEIEFETLARDVNGRSDPEYRLETAVEELKQILRKLKRSPGEYSAEIAAINKYIRDADRWSEEATYECRIENVPDGGHLHITVVPDNAAPNWTSGEQLFSGSVKIVEWQPGYDIHIAYHRKHSGSTPETWGEKADDRVVLNDKYCIRDFRRDVAFSNIQKSATITVVKGRMDLPRLKR